MKLVATCAGRTTDGKRFAYGDTIDEPDADRAAFWLSTGACVEPGSKLAGVAIQGARDGVPFDYAAGFVAVDDVLSRRVSVKGLDLDAVRKAHAPAGGTGKPADTLPPVPPSASDKE